MHYTDPKMASYVQKNITSLGPKEAEFLVRMASTGLEQFTVRDAIGFWGGPEMAWKKLRHLERKGWIARLERGKYLVIPLEAGTNRSWSEEPYLVASALVQPAAIAYWTAIRHWNWTEQTPRIIYVQTTGRKKITKRAVFGVQYQFVTVSKAKFFGHVQEWFKGKSVLITDKEKTLVDCADDVERAGTIEELIKAVKSGVNEISWAKLNDYVARFPNGAVPKRLGYLIESLIAELPAEAVQVLSSWRRTLRTGVVPLQPSRLKEGKISTRWRVRANVRLG